jgi:UbiD family decarboxylase
VRLPQDIVYRWNKAVDAPIEPAVTERAPCHEIVLGQSEVDLGFLPIPTWVPGKDVAPFINLGCMITKDAATSARNVGIYRLQVKSRTTTAVLWDTATQHAAMHYAAYQACGQAMPAAVAIGLAPDIIISAASKLPFGVDEFGIAGGLRGQAIQLTRCRTVDLEVPADAEIVLGILPNTASLKPGANTQNYGNMAQAPVFNVNASHIGAIPSFGRSHNGMPQMRTVYFVKC